MRSVIFDGSVLRLYPFGKPGFKGGTEQYVETIAHGLAERGYLVHVVASDLDQEEQRGPNEWWWPATVHPRKADYVVAVHNLQCMDEIGYTAQNWILMPNGIDPDLVHYEWGGRMNAVACFSECHVDLLTKARPSIRPEACCITGLGVNNLDYGNRPHVTFADSVERYTPGRLLYANDPARGLYHTLHVFDRIREELPDAELRIAYDFARQFENWRWQVNALAEQMWWCKERIERGNGVVNLGALSHEALVAEQLACDLHVYPSDPPNVGSQIHGILQMELAAAGVPLLLSDIEAFPEVFGEAATLLPLPGTLAHAGDGELARIDYDDWAQTALGLMRDRDRWQADSEAGRKLAAENDWSAVLDNWCAMLDALPLD